MGGNRQRARKSPKKFKIGSAAKHPMNQPTLPCILNSQDELETTNNAQNIMEDHSYTMQEPAGAQKFEFLKHKTLGDLTVGHLNVEKLGVLKRRELGTMLKSLDIDLLSIVEHHVPMDETEKMATTVKNCHSLRIPGYGVMSKHRLNPSGGVGWLVL